MNLGKPDRVPLMCQFSIGHMLMQLDVSPAEFWFDADVYANGLLELRDIYDFDGILVSLAGHDPRWKDHVLKIEPYADGEKVEWVNGDVTFCLRNDLPQHKKREQPKLSELAEITEKDLPQTLDYIPVSQNLHFHIQTQHKFDAIQKVVDKVGGIYSVHGEITSPFDYLFDWVGVQNALLGLILEPKKCKLILNHFTRLIKQLAMEMCSTGIDAIKISSPFAGSSFISPEYYCEFVLPYEREIAEEIRKNGIHAYTHTCGAINDRLELIFQSGVSGIECLDPLPLGNVELEDAFKRINDKGFIKGNVDSVNSLLHSTSEKILADAKTKIEIGKEQGGFILSTACSIAPGVTRENILLLRQAVERWG